MRAKRQDVRNDNILIYCNGNTTVQQVNSSAEILINKQQYLWKTLKYCCKLPASGLPDSCTRLHLQHRVFGNTPVWDCGCHRPDGTWNAHLYKTLGDSQCGLGGTEMCNPGVWPPTPPAPPPPAPSATHSYTPQHHSSVSHPPSHACPS